jgi:small GTP-binding protein
MNIENDGNETKELPQSIEESIPKDLESIKSIVYLTENFPNYDYIFSLCLVGNANVGKTSLLKRYCEGVFKEKYTNTIGVDFKIISLRYKENNIKLHLWDTAGQERFRSITVNYFRNVHGFFFVYDINSKDSFEAVDQWLEIAKSYNKNANINFLVANKSDLTREVSVEEGVDYARKRNLIYFETSAKNNDNVDTAFNYMAHKLFEFYSKNRNIYNNLSSNNSANGKNNVEIGKKLSSGNERKCC